tara:strand:- start:631 stop:1047 length:417 start_codon:yes stop_codon:yes gene_type:complete
MNLVELTIDYGDGHYEDIEKMVVTYNSEAYRAIIAYAEVNEYPITEENYHNEKQMAWVLRGFLSTNTWENIDELVEQYDLQRDELRARNLDDYRGDDPTPSRDEVLDKIFEYFTEDAEEGERRKLWDEINQYIQKENA